MTSSHKIIVSCLEMSFHMTLEFFSVTHVMELIVVDLACRFLLQKNFGWIRKIQQTFRERKFSKILHYLFIFVSLKLAINSFFKIKIYPQVETNRIAKNRKKIYKSILYIIKNNFFSPSLSVYISIRIIWIHRFNANTRMCEHYQWAQFLCIHKALFKVVLK